jgi:hypothetical protein
VFAFTCTGRNRFNSHHFWGLWLQFCNWDGAFTPLEAGLWLSVVLSIVLFTAYSGSLDPYHRLIASPWLQFPVTSHYLEIHLAVSPAHSSSTSPGTATCSSWCSSTNIWIDRCCQQHTCIDLINLRHGWRCQNAKTKVSKSAEGAKSVKSAKSARAPGVPRAKRVPRAQRAPRMPEVQSLWSIPTALWA